MKLNQLMPNLAIACVVMVAALMVSSCANVTSKQVPTIPGIDTSSINMFINNDDGAVTLTGQVSREVDKKIIEEHLSIEYGYKDITNSISID